MFAAFTGLARAFVQEEEARTAAALRLAAPPTAVYLGKLLFNLLLLLLLDALTAVLFVILLRVQIGNLGLFVALLLAGSLGLVAATTLIAAIIARASVKGALFAVLSFPLLAPLLVVAIKGTALALDGAGWDVGPRRYRCCWPTPWRCSWRRCFCLAACGRREEPLMQSSREARRRDPLKLLSSKCSSIPVF